MSAAIHAVPLSAVAAPCDDDENHAIASMPNKGRPLQKNINGRRSVLIFFKKKIFFTPAASLADDLHSIYLRTVESRAGSNLGNYSRLDFAQSASRTFAAAASNEAHTRVPVADGADAVMQCKTQSRDV